MSNSKMRIFITGANGQLAKSIISLYQEEELFLADRKTLDITDKKKVLSLVAKFKPDIIFHFASLTRGDECAKDPEKAFTINVKGTQNIIEACQKVGAELLFVSTNEVFDGKKKSRYTEKDKPNPITVVGQTKLEAEKLIAKSLKKYYIVRTSWLYSDWSSNFLHVVVGKAKKDGQLELVSDEVSSPTYSLDLALALQKLIKSHKYGLYHLANFGTVSRLNFAKEAFKILKIKKVKIIPKKLKDFNRLSKPPLFTPLNSSKAKKLGIVLPKWNKSLESFLKIAKL